MKRRHGDKGLAVLAVNAWGEPADKLSAFSEQMGINYAILLNGGAVARDYGVRGIPATFLIDRQGNIVHREVGFSPANVRQFASHVESLVGG